MVVFRFIKKNCGTLWVIAVVLGLAVFDRDTFPDSLLGNTLQAIFWVAVFGTILGLAAKLKSDEIG